MKIALQKLYNFAELKQLCTELTNLTNIGIAIIDLEGKIIISTGWQQVCTHFHRVHPQTSALCSRNKEYTQLIHSSDEGYVIQKCDNGMYDVALKLKIDGQHVANFFAGPFLKSKDELDNLIEKAKLYKFDLDYYIKSLQKVPILDKQKLDLSFNFMFRFVDSLSYLGSVQNDNILKSNQLNREISSYKELNSELQLSNKMLSSSIRGLKHSINFILKVAENYPNATVSIIDLKFGVRFSTKMPFDLNKFLDPDWHGYALESLYQNSNQIMGMLDLAFMNQSNTQEITKGEQYFALKAVPLLDDHNKVYSVLLVEENISGRKKRELEIIESKDNYQKLSSRLKATIKSIPDTLIRINSDDVITYYKEGESLLFDYPEMIIGKKYNEVFPKSICSLFSENISKLLLNSEYSNFEFSHRFDHSKLNFYSASLSMSEDGEITVVCRDVTQEKIYNQNILIEKSKAIENEEKFKKFFDQSQIGFIIMDVDLNLVEVNQAFCQFLHYDKQELMLMNFRDLIFDEDLDIDRQEFDFLSHSLIDDYKIDKRLKTKIGGEIYTEISLKCNVFANGKPRLYYALVNNISERKKLEFDLIKAKEKAEESDNLKSEFISNLSHEIRTPMNGILGFSDFLGKADLSESKRKKYISIIQSSGKQLLNVIDDIIEISKLSSRQIKANIEEVNINDLLLENFAIFDIKAKESKSSLFLMQGIDHKKSLIYTDRLKLNKILNNIIENALKFTHQGYVEIGSHLKKNSHGEIKLVIYVKDTGIGVPKNMQKEIFNRFSRDQKINNNKNGLGLGLAIAKENAKLIGAKIHLESQEGVGSKFSIVIPYKSVNQYVDSSFDPKTDNEKCLILVAEDEEINFMYIHELITQDLHINCMMIHAKDGEEALEICKNHSNINLVFMDLKMPKMDGFAASKEIKKLCPTLPIIAMSAYSSQQNISAALNAGCELFLVKPVDKKAVEESIKNYINI